MNLLAEKALKQARAVWHLADTNGNEAYPFQLATVGAVRFAALEGEAVAASRLRGGDGHAAVFEGGYLTLQSHRARRLRPKSDTLVLYVRACLEEWESGALFYSDFLSLTVHPTGLVVAFLGVQVPTGRVYRELPLGYVTPGGWKDFVLTVAEGRMRLYVDGVRLCDLPLCQPLCAPFDDDMVIGGFRCNKPDTYDDGLPICRLRNGWVDTVALWHTVLDEKQIAALSGRDEVDYAPLTGRQAELCRLHNAFFDASAAKDLPLCRELSARLYTLAGEDVSRPVYHLTQPFGVIYDPCGAFYHDGRYHVFSYHNIQYILQYSSLDHYVSEDLVHWEMWPIAPFADGECDVFCIYLLNHFYDDEGNLRTLYTGQGTGGKCGVLARTDDGMLSYTDKKVVLSEYHHDGHVFKHGDRWYTITSKLCRGSRSGDRGDPVMLWSSADLESWVEEGEIFTQRKWERNPAGFMEFPYLIPFGEKYALILGGHPVYYWVGRFDWETKTFLPDKEERTLLDRTNPFHCFNPLCVDDKGENGAPRRLLMAMYRDVGGQDLAFSHWCCAHAQPRVLTLEGDHLRQDPLPELAVRRGAVLVDGYPGGRMGNCAELYARFALKTTGRYGVELADPVTGESLRVWLDAGAGIFGIEGDVNYAGDGPAYQRTEASAELRVFIDRRLVEVFVNGQSCTTATTSLWSPETTVRVLGDDTPAACEELRVWDMENNE